jgi:hypothetical protein
LIGYDVWTKIVRNGIDIGYLARNPNYDFNYQNYLTLKPSVVLTKVSFPFILLLCLLYKNDIKK